MDLMFTTDLVISKGDIQLVTGANETGQRVQDRLETFKGEWFLDLSYGPDYRNNVFVKNPRLNIVGALLKAEILKSAPNAQFSSFDASLGSDRKLTIDYELSTIDGTISATVTP